MGWLWKIISHGRQMLQVLSITSMGFPREMALTALESTHGDVNAAINKLLESC